jgi:RNA polymerase sigma-70 factor (ECF subfamily)
MEPLIDNARLEELGIAPGSKDAQAIERALAEAVTAARAAHPGVDGPTGDFVEFVLGRAGKDAAHKLKSLHLSDLWLARACAARVRGAAEALDPYIAGGIGHAVRGLDPSPAFRDDVRQAVRDKLLVGNPPRGPGIASYGGEGALAIFVRVAARRTALNLKASTGHLQVSESALRATPGRTPDPETQLLLDKYQRDFRAAFMSALRELSAGDRQLLRQRYVDGLSGARIAQSLGVAPSTVTRTLQSLRSALKERARLHLEKKLRLSQSQIDSLAALVVSQLDVSLSGALKD